MLYRWLTKTAVLLFLPFTIESTCTVISYLPIPLYAHQLGYGYDPNTIYLFGGINSGGDINSIYKWNVSIPSTFTKLSITTPISIFRSYSNNVVSINDKIYFVGTDDGVWTSGAVYIFDTNTETWIDNSNVMKPLHPAIYGCLTQNTTHIFFIGGRDGVESYLKTLQIYNINTNQWVSEDINESPIKEIGWSVGYCQFVNEYLYIFGGETSYRIDHIFKWNSVMKWQYIGNLPYVLSNGISVYYDQYIYIIGGETGAGNVIESYMSIIYEFDTNIDEIVNVYDMGVSIAIPTAGIINHKLYIFGGIYNDAGIYRDVTDVQICDIIPSLSPTTNPTCNPSYDPSFNPSYDPTFNPSLNPTYKPSFNPSYDPTFDPSFNPTMTQTTMDIFSISVTMNNYEYHSTNMKTNNIYEQTNTDLLLTILFWLIGILSAVIFIILLLICIYFGWKRYKKSKRKQATKSMDNMPQITEIIPSPHKVDLSLAHKDDQRKIAHIKRTTGEKDESQESMDVLATVEGLEHNAYEHPECIAQPYMDESDHENDDLWDEDHKEVTQSPNPKIIYNMDHSDDEENISDDETQNETEGNKHLTPYI